MRACDSVIFNRKYGSEMPQPVYRAEKSNAPSTGLYGGTLLAIMPVLTILYVLLILPFFPDDGKGRWENILIWPLAAALTSMLIFRNWARVDHRFFSSLPIMALIAYLVFAAASVTWAFSPDFAFTR